MKSSLPVVALSGLGIVIAVLGFFAAGDIAIVVVGLGAMSMRQDREARQRVVHHGLRR